MLLPGGRGALKAKVLNLAANPPLIRAGAGASHGNFVTIYVSENAFQAILKPIFLYSITSILTKVRDSNSLFFAFNYSFLCYPLCALARLCYFILALPWPTK